MAINKSTHAAKFPSVCLTRNRITSDSLSFSLPRSYRCINSHCTWHQNVHHQIQNHRWNKQHHKAEHVCAPPPHILDHSDVASTGIIKGCQVEDHHHHHHQTTGNWLWLLKLTPWKPFFFRSSSLQAMIFNGGGIFVPGLPGFA